MQLRYALLAMLGEREGHGYELLKRFRARVGPFWHPNIGQVYQLLHELAGRGLVVCRDEPGAPRLRRVFRLTPRGSRALRTWLARRPGWPAPMRDEILVRLLATEAAGPHALLDQLARQEAEYRRYLDLVRSQGGPANATLVRRLADAAAVSQAEAHLAWLEAARALIERTALRCA